MWLICNRYTKNLKSIDSSLTFRRLLGHHRLIRRKARISKETEKNSSVYPKKPRDPWKESKGRIVVIPQPWPKQWYWDLGMLPNKAESFSLCWKGAWVSEGRSLRLSVGQFVCLSPLPVLSLLFETMMNEIWKCIIAKQEFLCKTYTIKKQTRTQNKKEARVPMSPDLL